MNRFMKKCLLLLAVLLMLTSCSIDNDEKADFNMAFIAADSVSTPDYVTPGRAYPFKIYYKRPNDCFYVNGIYMDANGYTLTLAVQSLFIEDANCAETMVEPEEATYTFQCPLEQTNSYTFKFYNGDDALGNRKFLTVILPVRQ